MLFFRNVNIASTHHSTRWATLRPGCMWFVVSCSLGAYIKACWWMDGCWFSAWWIWRCTLMVTIDTVLLNSTPVCYYGMAQHLPPLLSSISRKVLKAQRCSHLLCDVLWMTNSCSWPRAEANKWRASALYLKQCLIVTGRRGSVALTHRNMEIRRLVHKVDVDLFGNAAKTRHIYKSAEL